MKGDTNMTTVEALKNLYTALGGDEADVADLKLNPEVVEALAGLDIGGGEKLSLYFDPSESHGSGLPLDPFILYEDEEFSKPAPAPALDKWADIIIIMPSIGQSLITISRPNYAVANEAGTEIGYLCVVIDKTHDELGMLYFGFDAGK